MRLEGNLGSARDLLPFSAHFLKNPSPKPEAPPVITIVFPATHPASYGTLKSIGGDCRVTPIMLLRSWDMAEETTRQILRFEVLEVAV